MAADATSPQPDQTPPFETRPWQDVPEALPEALQLLQRHWMDPEALKQLEEQWYADQDWLSVVLNIFVRSGGISAGRDQGAAASRPNSTNFGFGQALPTAS